MSNNIIGLIELNLIDVYLGKHSGFGADDAYYKQSDYFIPSIAYQQDMIFNELLHNDNIDINNKLFINLNELRDNFKKWGKNKNNSSYSDYLKSIYEIHISNLIRFITVFHKTGKIKIAHELRNQIAQIFKIYNDNNFRKKIDKNIYLENPIWNSWEDFIYLKLIVDNEDVFKIFNENVRKEYKNVSEVEKYSYIEEGKEKLIKSFIRCCLRHRLNDLIELINEFDEYELISFLDILRKLEYIPIFLKNINLQNIIKNKISKLKIQLNEYNSFILFYKKLLSIKLKKSELLFAKKEFDRLKDTRSVDYHRLDIPINYATMSFVLDQNTFEYFLRKQEGYAFRNYFELGLYSALYKDYISLLRGNKNVEAVIRDYVSYMNYYTEGTYDSKYLNKDMSCMISYIISNAEHDLPKLKNLIRLLSNFKDNFSLYNFFLQLFLNDINLFSNLINERDLLIYETELFHWNDDYQSYVDRCFQLASFYSNLDNSKAISFIIKGINDGILRHGWRKDIIVSYYLVDALEILWRNGWETKEKLDEYSRDVFNLTLKVTEITDGKNTWEGPYNLINLIIKYDMNQAYELERKFIKYLGRRDYSISLTTSFLLEKIKRGFPFDEIVKEMEEYRKDYGFDGKPRSTYYEEKLKIFLEVATSDLYNDEIKVVAFNKAYGLVEEVIKQKIKYFLLNDNKYEILFNELCIKYNKPLIIPSTKKDNVSYSINSEEKIKNTCHEFIPKIINAKSLSDIKIIYKELSNYNFGRIITECKVWKILINKTFSICGNISLFINLLKKDSFPHYDHITSNSQYYHFGLAEALNNINTRREIIKYLSEYSGYGGFINIMKAYEVNKNKEMCNILFDRYLKFCHLLTD